MLIPVPYEAADPVRQGGEKRLLMVWKHILEMGQPAGVFSRLFPGMCDVRCDPGRDLSADGQVLQGLNSVSAGYRFNDYSDIGIIWTTKRSLEQKGLRSAG